MFRTGGNVQVTAYGGTPSHCEIVGWAPDSGGTNVDVACFNAAGSPADAFFTLSYAIGTTEAEGPSRLFGAYAWANNPTKRNYNPKKPFTINQITTTPLTAQRPPNAFRLPGIYTLTVPGTDGLTFNLFFGMATAYGSAGEFCNFDEFDDFTTEIDMGVSCYDAGGRNANVRYVATMALGQ
jgi:hypothetical protein